jgi:hypothetical protein
MEDNLLLYRPSNGTSNIQKLGGAGYTAFATWRSPAALALAASGAGACAGGQNAVSNGGHTSGAGAGAGGGSGGAGYGQGNGLSLGVFSNSMSAYTLAASSASPNTPGVGGNAGGFAGGAQGGGFHNSQLTIASNNSNSASASISIASASASMHHLPSMGSADDEDRKSGVSGKSYVVGTQSQGHSNQGQGGLRLRSYSSLQRMTNTSNSTDTAQGGSVSGTAAVTAAAGGASAAEILVPGSGSGRDRGGGSAWAGAGGGAGMLSPGASNPAQLRSSETSLLLQLATDGPDVGCGGGADVRRDTFLLMESGALASSMRFIRGVGEMAVASGRAHAFCGGTGAGRGAGGGGAGAGAGAGCESDSSDDDKDEDVDEEGRLGAVAVAGGLDRGSADYSGFISEANTSDNEFSSAGTLSMSVEERSPMGSQMFAATSGKGFNTSTTSLGVGGGSSSTSSKQLPTKRSLRGGSSSKSSGGGSRNHSHSGGASHDHSSSYVTLSNSMSNIVGLFAGTPLAPTPAQNANVSEGANSGTSDGVAAAASVYNKAGTSTGTGASHPIRYTAGKTAGAGTGDEPSASVGVTANNTNKTNQGKNNKKPHKTRAPLQPTPITLICSPGAAAIPWEAMLLRSGVPVVRALTLSTLCVSALGGGDSNSYYGHHSHHHPQATTIENNTHSKHSHNKHGRNATSLPTSGTKQHHPRSSPLPDANYDNISSSNNTSDSDLAGSVERSGSLKAGSGNALVLLPQPSIARGIVGPQWVRFVGR